MNNSKTKTIAMAIICAILAMAITLQVRTISGQSSGVLSGFANDELKDSLLEWKEKYEESVEQLEKSEKELEEARTTVVADDSNSQTTTQQIKQNNLLLGNTNVTGDGIIITAKDGEILTATDDISKYLVHDGDLRGIVSELCNAGAEAISINDERVVNSTCIVCAGNVISINGERVSSPFIIKAIGNQERLYTIDRPGSYLEYMKGYTTVEVSKASNIKIKKFSGVLPQKYMKNVNANKK